MAVFKARRGYGPYGITITPKGDIWYASLAGNYIARIDLKTAQATVVDPPTPKQGARRVWSDSRGRLWVSEWNSGNVSVHDPADGSWRVWKLPGERPRTYSVYVDEKDIVWLTDFAANAIVRFDPATERFHAFPSDKPSANVRQMAGRAGQAWGGEIRRRQPGSSSSRRRPRREGPARRSARRPAHLGVERRGHRGGGARGGACLGSCRACHSLDRAADPMPGPNLAALAGRRVAGDPQFDYSPVLRQAVGATGATWTAGAVRRLPGRPGSHVPRHVDDLPRRLRPGGPAGACTISR